MKNSTILALVQLFFLVSLPIMIYFNIDIIKLSQSMFLVGLTYFIIKTIEDK